MPPCGQPWDAGREMVPRRLRFSLELVENSPPLDAESPPRSWLARAGHRRTPLVERLVNPEVPARLLPTASPIGQLF